ncbi:MAG: dihydrolipoyl dehydrogenase [Opitutales bacterium]|nr:dihydrolipoyl dehydrogenase [Opitutales bacterium]
MSNYDIAVIGAGPGGYVCALHAAKLGLSVALVDEREALGGTCLNIGCIPSKALLHSSELLTAMQNDAAANGIALAGVPTMDVPLMMARKQGIVDKLSGGISMLCKQAKVRVLQGHATLLGSGKISIAGKDAGEITAKDIVLATGSSPVELPFMPFDGKRVVSSTEALSFEAVPEKLLVIGAGAIGLELGSVWARLGSEVTLLEFLPQIAPTFDADVSKYLQRMLVKQGLSFHLETKVTGCEVKDGNAIVSAEKGGNAITFETDKVLVSVGRRPNTAKLGLEEAGVTLDEKGRVETDAELRTKAAGIWAIGDLVAGPMLAHKAEAEARLVAERIAGRKAPPLNHELIPGVVYTSPEVAGAGLTETQAKARGIEVKVGKAYYAANGRALASDAADGFAKLISDKASERLLGVQIVGQSASELIAEAVAHMEYGGSAEDIALCVHAHPTLSEVLKAAAE